MRKEHATKYTAIFKDGTEVTKTSREGFRNRLDVYNWICKNELGEKHGALQAIEARPIL